MHLRSLLIPVVALLMGLVGCSIGGGTQSVNAAIKNGQIILVRQGSSAYGLLVPKRQSAETEGVTFTWYYRTDGRGTFKSADHNHYRTGTGVGVHVRPGPPWLTAKFGPFAIGWSSAEDKVGYLYYARSEGEAVSPSDVRICVTKETDVQKVDAASPRWLYKGSPDDSGIRGGAKP